ncbi:ribosomal protein S3 [Kalaharituber pfeilii]|nr:ribosomal protein S3 [Kalaharituber pfeilii]
MASATSTQISKRRKFVADGVFYAELNEFFTRELAEEGYSGVEVRVTPTVTDIIIRATHTQEVLGEQGRRIRELTSLIQKRFKFPENSVSLYAAKVQNRGLCAVAQCESLRYKLLNGLAVRRACYGVLRFIMESGAKGCEVVVSGKLRAARAKSMKFTDGFMIHSGQPAKDFIDTATRHVLLRQGVLGIKVKIMRGSDPDGKSGPQKSLPDTVTIIEPKEEPSIITQHLMTIIRLFLLLPFLLPRLRLRWKLRKNGWNLRKNGRRLLLLLLLLRHFWRAAKSSQRLQNLLIGNF